MTNNMKNSTAIILILIAVGLFYTFINPQYQKTKVLRVEAGHYENVLKNASELSRTSQELMIDMSDISPLELERLSKILPNGIDTVKLARDLDTIASRYGVAITNVEVDTKSANQAGIIHQATGAPYEKVTMSFGFISDYNGFRNFLRDMERSLRLIDVRAVNFRSTQTGLYEFRVSFDTYWIK